MEITGQNLGLQPSQTLSDRLLQRAEILLMDDNVLGVSLLMICRAKEGKILVSQKEGWIEGNIIVQRLVLSAGGGPHHRDDPAADTQLRKGAEPGAPV